MRNNNVIQATGSKVTHLPVEPALTACGRTIANSLWQGGYYETLPEITCKSCLKYIPKGVTWNTTTAQFIYAPGQPYGTNASPHASDSFEILGCKTHPGATWLPSADGDPAGILVLWETLFSTGRFWIYTNKQS